MAIVYTDNIEPRKPTQEITLGTTGETITLPGNDLRVNTVKDKGGNTLWTSDGSGNLSSVNSGLKGNLTLLSTQTASNSASVSFTTLIDSTYDLYIFKFIEINPATDTTDFKFQGSTDSGASYGVTKTTTAFWTAHSETTGATELGYRASQDLAQSTSPAWLTDQAGNGADENASGELYLFSPSNTTYVKQFYSTFQYYQQNNYSTEFFGGGYFNTTSAITAMQFTSSSGNFDGTIKMYGLS